VFINVAGIKGEPYTGYENPEGKGPFACDNCHYWRNDGCSQKDMKRHSRQPKLRDGRVKVDPKGCCEFVDRIGKRAKIS
jgi:hypothetical protein